MFIRRSNCTILRVFLMMMVAVPVIWTGAWLSHQSSTRCDSHLNKPFLVIGVFLLLLSLARLILYLSCRGAHQESTDNCINFGVLVLFLVLLGYTVFALVVTTTPTRGQSEGGNKDIDVYKYNYSKWLRNRVLDNNQWRHIKNCLVFKTKVCSSFPHVIHNDSNYQRSQSSHFSSIQYGCCIPTKDCNFTYTSRAIWTKPTNGTTSKPDCDEWSDDPYVLCFNCESCKDGFLHDIKTTWKKAAIVNIVVIFALVMLWWCGDCGPDPEEDNDQ